MIFPYIIGDWIGVLVPILKKSVVDGKLLLFKVLSNTNIMAFLLTLPTH